MVSRWLKARVYTAGRRNGRQLRFRRHDRGRHSVGRAGILQRGKLASPWPGMFINAAARILEARWLAAKRAAAYHFAIRLSRSYRQWRPVLAEEIIKGLPPRGGSGERIRVRSGLPYATSCPRQQPDNNCLPSVWRGGAWGAHCFANIRRSPPSARELSSKLVNGTIER